MKIKVFLFFLTLISCVKINSKQKKDCYIFMEPIVKIDLSGDSNKTDILEYLDEFVKLSGENLKYTPKDIDLFNGNKKITLPNGFISSTKFNLRFRGEKLVGYKAFIEIGDDYNYFWKLIELIKKSDKNNINGFIYESDRKPSYRDLFDKKDCKRMISVQRNYENNETFEIKIAVN